MHSRTNFIRNLGFSLVELMIVVAIIGILAAIAIPQFQRFTSKARRAEAVNVLRGLDTAQKAYVASSETFLAGPAQSVFTALGFQITSPKFYFILPTDIIRGCADFGPCGAGAGGTGTCPVAPAPCPAYLAFLSGDIDNDDTLDQVAIHQDSIVATPGASCCTDFSGFFPTGAPVVVWDDLIL